MDIAAKLKLVTDEAIRLMAVVEIGKLLNSTLDLDRILEIILDTAIKNLQADRGTVYLIDTDKGEIWSKVLQGDMKVEIRLPIGQGIAGHVALTGEHVILADAYEDPRFNRDIDKRSGYRTKTMLCMPMKNRNGRMVGVFQIINKKEGEFTDDDVRFLETLSVDACIAVENAQLHEESIEKERMEKELEVASTIQRMILPKEIEQPEGYDIVGMNDPSRQVGGDYYDVIPLSDDNIALVIADVSGKSVPGALLVSSLQASMHAYLEASWKLPQLVAKLNKVILRNSTADKYITFFIAILNPKTGELTSVNAGHNPPLLMQNGKLRKLKTGGIPLGMVDFDAYEQEQVQLDPGDLLLCFTDGVTEATDASDELYDDDRLEAFTARHCALDAKSFMDKLYGEIKSFVGEAEQSDDITVLVIKRK
jgi:sigma-B regulation protein RsbU (phosphoserine phosphatase)